jgi:hypothetical protein
MRKREAQYFGISGFGIPRLQKPNIKHKQFSEMRKRESGSRISGFRELGLWGFRGFKYPNTAYNNPQIKKTIRCGIHCFEILGFGISRFTNTWCVNTTEKENPKCEK